METIGNGTSIVNKLAKTLFEQLNLKWNEMDYLQAISELRMNLAETLGEKLLEAPLQYRVPRITDSNECSFGMVQNPFELKWAVDLGEKNQLRLRRLFTALSWLHERTQLDWVGLYQKVEAVEIPSYIDDFYGQEAGVNHLTKLCYVGAPSRALFPLSQEFASGSNNSRCYLEQQALVIQNIDHAKQQGQPYYECDPKVRSEISIPLSWQGLDVGLFDGEAFSQDFFTQENILACLGLVDFVHEEGLLV